MKKRELVLVLFLLTLISGVSYYFFYFTPNSETIVQLETEINRRTQDINAASARTIQHGLLTNTKNQGMDTWNYLKGRLPERFDDADILNRIQAIVVPRVGSVTVRFAERASMVMQETEVHTAEMIFLADYETLMDILDDITHEKFYDRVINLSYRRIETDILSTLSVTMTVDFLVSRAL